jgi:hypothetical protein
MFKYSELDFYFRKNRTEATTFLSNGYAIAIIKKNDENDVDTGLNDICVLKHDENGLTNLYDFKLENKSLTDLTEDQVESIMFDISNLSPITNYEND